MAEYIPKIGLEIHAELKTKTKMFCGSLNDPNENHPNINVCPVCMGYPGVLPVINKVAVKSVMRVGLALGGKPADFSRFDRKNYFYPDLPKGYQISQYQHPLIEGGSLNGIRIRRVHLEEDTGRLVHEHDASLIDFNRAGVPLMELVTEPDISSGPEAAAFAEELQLIFRYLEVSDADMEKGQMRVEVNISIAEASKKLGTKVEIKNLNSFKAVEQAVKYETERQAELLEEGKSVVQETRGWDDGRQKTFSQRTKEEAHDYRYFPEPDLPVMQIAEFEEFSASGGNDFRMTIPELPQAKRLRFEKEYGLDKGYINFLAADRKLADFFESAVSEAGAELPSRLAEAPAKRVQFRKQGIDTVINYLSSDLFGLMKEKFLNLDDLRVTPKNFAALVSMIIKGMISSRVAKDVLRTMVETGAEPNSIVREAGLEQTSDENYIETAARKAISGNHKAAEDYKKGRVGSLQFLVGQVMKETRGKTNPQMAAEILKRLLSG